MHKKCEKVLFITFCLFIQGLAIASSQATYIEYNNAKVLFDVSMPIDATGYLLHGKNLTGGNTSFTDQGTQLSPDLAIESGKITTPNGYHGVFMNT